MKKLLFFLVSLGAGLTTFASDKLPIGSTDKVHQFLDSETKWVVTQTTMMDAPYTYLISQVFTPRDPGVSLAKVIGSNVVLRAKEAQDDGQTNLYKIVSICMDTDNVNAEWMMLGANNCPLDFSGGSPQYPAGATNVATLTNLQWHVPVMVTNLQWARVTTENGQSLDDSRTNSRKYTNLWVGKIVLGSLVNTNTLYIPMRYSTGAVSGVLEVATGSSAESAKTKRYNLLTGLRLYENHPTVGIRVETNTPVVAVTGDWEGQVSIEQSTNLVNWTAVTNLTLSVDGFGEIRGQSTNSSPTGFYRVRYRPE